MTDEEKKELYPMLPRIPKKFREWAEARFDGRRTFFFTRKQGNLHVECCHCGSKFVKEDTEEVETFLQEPKGAYVKCPKCRAIGKLVSKKNRKHSISIDVDLWYGQKLKNGGWILRFFRPILASVPDKEKSYEAFELSERMRYWFPAGMKKKLYKEFYHPWGWYGGTWNSTYCFLTMGWTDNSPTCGHIYPETWKNMKDTVMQYSMTHEALTEHPEIGRYFTIGDWQQAYIKNPWYEMLLKTGLTQIILDKERYGLRGVRLYSRAKTPWDYLKIDKKRFRDLTQKAPKAQSEALRIYRLEKITGCLGEYADDLIDYDLDEKRLNKLLEYSTPIKAINYIRKQKGQDKSAWVREWLDYLDMKKEMGYDMTDSIVLFPKNLKAAHNKAVIEKDSKAAEERKKEVEKNFGLIRSRFKDADKVYHYESGSYMIRPAMSASEIVDEGRYLHHCVGGDGYLRKHNDKTTIICFLRTKKNPEEPYITVELRNGKIEQWYGYLDEKPDEEKIDRWLKRYVKNLDPEKVRREAHRKIKAS